MIGPSSTSQALFTTLRDYPCDVQRNPFFLPGFGFVLDLRFPSPCHELMDALTFFNLELFGFIPFACWVEADYFLNLIFTTLMPLVFSFGLFVVHRVYSPRVKGLENVLISAFLLVTFLVLPECSKKIFATFRCNDYDAMYEDGKDETERLLAMDLSVDCGWPNDTAQYVAMQTYAVLMILVYPIGIPAMYTVLLYKERFVLAIEQHQNLADKPRLHAIQKTFFGFRATTSVRSPDPEKQKALEEEWEELKTNHYLAFLIAPYERRVYWFEVVEVYRRLLLSGVLVLFGAGSVFQVLMACAICLISIKVFIFYDAFADDDDDILAEVAQWQLFGVLSVGMVIRFNDLLKETGGDGVIEDDFMLGSMTTLIMMVGLILTFALALKVYYFSIRDARDEGGGEPPLDAPIEETGNPMVPNQNPSSLEAEMANTSSTTQPPSERAVPQFAHQPPALPSKRSIEALRPRLTKVPSSHLAPPSPATEGASSQSDLALFDVDLGTHATVVVEDDDAKSDDDGGHAGASTQRPSEMIGGHLFAINQPSRRSTLDVLGAAEVERVGADSGEGVLARKAEKRNSLSAVL